MAILQTLTDTTLLSAVPGARKVVEQAQIGVIQEAWIGGISTRRVDELVQAMGLSGIRKSQVPKLCKEIDERVHAFFGRPLVSERPDLWLDVTYYSSPSAVASSRWR